jgi:predicted TIM-barrel fold metal-dependent hydrolase
MNDWNIDRWLSIDDERLCSVVLAPTQDPVAAAKEIRRVGAHPRIKEVLLVVNGMGRPFGDAAYDPIYRAAADLDLPVAIHVGGDHHGLLAKHSAGGNGNSRMEFHALI